jgi:predicted dehydrogenase
MPDTTTFTRRSLLAGAAAAGGARTALGAAPAPPRVLGANDRLRVGVIGAGGNARGHMRAVMSLQEQDNVEIIGVCDLYKPRLEEAAELTGGKPFHDYRKLLELEGLDYVVVSVPEHWHAPITLDALDQGLHVYCEKPLTYSIEEGLEVRKKVKETGLKLQCGIQGMSDDSYETAARYIEEGAIGKPVMAQIDYSRNEKVDLWHRPPDEGVEPGVNLDWQTFLGKAPKREWEPDRFFSWRRYWDYSGGIATDLFVHRIARIVKACKLTAPSRVVATGGKHFFTESTAEVPDTFNVMLEYPEGMTVMLVSTLANESRIRHMIRGRKATLEFTREGFVIAPERLFEGEAMPATHTKSGGEDMALHHHNLHNAIRHGADLKCDADFGFYASMACQMAVESFRRRKYLAWDATVEKVIEA